MISDVGEPLTSEKPRWQWKNCACWRVAADGCAPRFAGLVNWLVLRRASEDRIVAVKDRLHAHERPLLRVVGVVAHPFAEWAFRPGLAGNGLALDRDLAIGWNRKAGIGAAHHIDRLAAKSSRDVVFADFRQRT